MDWSAPLKSIIKKHALLILAIFFGYSAYALATTYTRPNGTAQYVGGAKAVGPAIDADFNDLTLWLNTGNISSVNILSGSIGASQLAAANLVVSSSSSIAVISSVSPVAVTNLSVTATVSGLRPVWIRLEPTPAPYMVGANQFYGSAVRFIDLVGSSIGSIFLIKDSATTAAVTLQAPLISSGSDLIGACSMLSYQETPAAGVHTWAVMASVSDASNAIVSVINCRLVVQEL